MGGHAKPGAKSQTADPIEVRDGTSALIASPKPGAAGAQGSTQPKTPARDSVVYWSFLAKDKSVCKPAVALGVNPGGEFLNAMEIVFKEEDFAKELRLKLGRGGFTGYRVRQTIEEQSWQMVGGKWSLMSSVAAGTADDPFPEMQCVGNPPYLRAVDTPGWSGFLGVGPKTRQLVVNKIKSDLNATQVVVQQNFRTWVEGERVYLGDWVRASIEAEWHNIQWLVRDTPTSDWKTTNQSEIASGPIKLGSGIKL